MTEIIKTYCAAYYYKEKKLHREDGPAVEYDNGDHEWWVNGKLHRLDGPAVEYADGGHEWWVYGKLQRASATELGLI